MSNVVPIIEKPTLDSVVSAMKIWRKNKGLHEKSRIPKELWSQIFELSQNYQPCVIRQLLGIIKIQYDKKLTEFFPAKSKNPNPLPKKSESEVTSIEFCEVEPDDIPTVNSQPRVVSSKKYTPRYDEVPKFIGVNTVIVEFCRADGKIMKIHTTSHCFNEIINSFYTGASDVTGNS